jgi:SAM-dependent methyltransferase
MRTTEDMIQINRKQAEFYDSIQQAEAEAEHQGYSENEKANLLTRAWAGLRYRQQEAVKAAGVEELAGEAQMRWAATKAGGDFLEIGCFSGSRITFRLAELSGRYLGVELSPKAVASLNQKLHERGLGHKAKAAAVDFLTLDASHKFDVLYAHGVLHHFQNPQPLFERLATLARPGALLVFSEPSAIHPLYRIVRTLYRPFQSDAAWEWPFTRQTVNALETYFEPVEGFGWGRWSLPLSVLTGLPLAGGFLRAAYLNRVRAEVKQGWHPTVWHNSYVTAMYRMRKQ